VVGGGWAHLPFFTRRSSNWVAVVDTASKKVVAVIAVGYSPVGVAINPSGTRLYVANFYSDTVSVINTVTNKVTGTVKAGVHPYLGMVVSPSGTRLYVGNYGSNSVSVINTATNKVIRTISLKSFPLGIAINPLGAP
jgi:YVTN family beta-propeller protein